MRKTPLIFLLIMAVLLQVSWRDSPLADKVLPKLKTWVLSELGQTTEQLRLGQLKLHDPQQLQKLYHAARRHYKQVEFFTEYCSFRESRLYLNGPLVPKYDEDFGKRLIPPHGFQRIEELLFDAGEDLDTAALKREYTFLLYSLEQVRKQYEKFSAGDGLPLEMCQLELFRLCALMLNGYDATITQTNIQECGWALEGMEKAIGMYATNHSKNKTAGKIYRQLKNLLASCQRFLLTHPDYNHFPRLNFIVQYMNPVNVLIRDFHSACGLNWNSPNQAILVKNGFLFGEESFNPTYFSAYQRDSLHAEKQAALGKKLFYDPALSGNRQRSCSTCHDPVKAFTDGLSRSVSVSCEQQNLRNAPGLLNAIFQKSFFYDGRAFRLEQQIFQVIHNKNEMGGDLREIALRLKGSAEYQHLFSVAFEGSADTAITAFAIQKAIAEYERTLVSFHSRFDRYLRGETASLNPREVNGYNLFAGKALCGSCHFFPLFNGTVPPFYLDSEFEVIGVPEKTDNKNIDPDVGRYRVTNIADHRFAFKTPTVRNVSLTGPYMHNGIYQTLEEVVEFYHKGGGKGLGLDLPNQTLPFDSLQLTKTEKEDIILFMKALTDTSVIHQRK